VKVISAKISPAWSVYTLGATLCVALTICSRNFGDRGGPYFMATLTLAGVVYLLAIREFFATPTFARRVVVVGLVLAAVWNIAFLRVPAGADDDIHRYVWDGRVQRLDYNPYIVVPSDPALSGLHTPETRTLNHPDLPSPYPAGAELFFRAITAIHESVFALKVAFVICELAIVFVVLDILRSSGQPAHWVLAYAWNPLLATEVAGSGHIDIVGVLLLLVSVAALERRWRAVAALAFGLAIAVKVLPIVLLPLYWKRVRIRDAALAAIVVGLLYLPFLDHGRIPIGSLGTYVQSFRFNGPVFAALARVAPPQLLAGLAVLVGLATATWLRIRDAGHELSAHASRQTTTTGNTGFHRGAPPVFPLVNSVPPVVQASAFAWPMAASLLCAPVVYPWYLLWLLPFVGSASTVPIIIWTVSIIPTYYVWHLRTLGRPWLAPGWVMLLEYGSVAAAAAIVAIRRFTRPVTRPCSTD
jgi:alpha-1,6-mannosyltransferase